MLQGQPTLFEALLDVRDRMGRSTIALEDAERRPLSYGRLVLGSLVLGRKMAGFTEPGECVAVLLPNVQSTVLVLLGLNAFARVPAMLDVTAGLHDLVAACDAAGIRTIITSRRFAAQAKLEDVTAILEQGRRVLWLENVRATVSSLDKFVGIVESFRARTIHAGSGPRPDDPAVIFFAARSGEPPQILALSSADLLADVRRVKAHAGETLTTADVFFTLWPLFDRFGLTAGLLTALLGGMKVVLHPSPRDDWQVPKLIRATRATVMVAPDTHLQGYALAADDGDLASIRYVVAGAEPVAEETRRLWARYGTIILDGFGDP